MSLREEVAEEVVKYRIGCNLKRECLSKCGYCAADAVIPMIRKDVLKEVAEYLEGRYRENFDRTGSQQLYTQWWDNNWVFIARLKAGLFP